MITAREAILKMCSFFARKTNRNIIASPKPLFSDVIRVVNANSNQPVDLNETSLKTLQLESFYENTVKFNPDKMNVVDRSRFYEVVDALTRTQRSKKFIDLEFLDADEAMRKYERNKYSAHVEEQRLFSNSDLLIKKMIYEAAKLFVDRKVRILKLPPFQTTFDNPYISSFLATDQGLVNSQSKIEKLPEKFKDLWKEGWYFTKLKGIFANVNLSLIPKQFTVYDSHWFTLSYVPDFHPLAATLTKSNPAMIVSKAKNVSMSTYDLREGAKLYKRLFFQHYVKLRFDRNNVYNEYEYLDTVFGKVELAAAGVAKKGLYVFKLKQKVKLNEENELMYSKLSEEIGAALEKTASIPWDSLILLCGKLLRKNQNEDLTLYNDLYAKINLNIRIEKLESGAR